MDRYTLLEVKYLTALKLLQGYEDLDWEIKFQELFDQTTRIIDGIYVRAEEAIKKRDYEIIMLREVLSIKAKRGK